MAAIAGLREIKIPMAIQYRFATNWKPAIPLLKNLVRPIYRNIFSGGTTLFFAKTYSSYFGG
jgi:hypothetical protein